MKTKTFFVIGLVSFLCLSQCSLFSTPKETEDAELKIISLVAEKNLCPENKIIYCQLRDLWQKSTMTIDDIPQGTQILVGLTYLISESVDKTDEQLKTLGLMKFTPTKPSDNVNWTSLVRTLIIKREGISLSAKMDPLMTDNEEENQIAIKLMQDLWSTDALWAHGIQKVMIPKNLMAYFEKLRTNPDMPPKPAQIEKGALRWRDTLDLTVPNSRFVFRKINDHLWMALVYTGEDPFTPRSDVRAHIRYVGLFTDRYVGG